MSVMDATMEAALGGHATVFVALQIDLPDESLRLVDGAGELVWGGETFVGLDDTYGALGGLDALSDGVDGEAPRLLITLLPHRNTATADLAAPGAQGSKVQIWFGVINVVTGAVVGEPFLVFVGELDVPVVRSGAGGRTLEYEVVSVWERFLEQQEGVRLNNAFHQFLWPGELGLEYATEVQRQLPWGSDAPRPSVVKDAGVPSSLGNLLNFGTVQIA